MLVLELGVQDNTKQKRNNLDCGHRDAVMADLLRGSSGGKLQKGDTQRVPRKFDSNRWAAASKALD